MINATKIIGLTGNIATGKSVIRQMLENSGALGIDADIIAHRMLYPDGPVYEEVIEAFGKGILSNGRISRRKLGEIVFNNTEKLAELETIVHPAATKSIQNRINDTENPIVVIEAIKLLEAGLDQICDAVWVSQASKSHQLSRLINSRQMSKSTAKSRIEAQPHQSAKLARANTIINTESSFKNTWVQIQEALNDTIQVGKISAPRHINISAEWTAQYPNSFPDKVVESFWQENSDDSINQQYECLGKQMVLSIGTPQSIEMLLIWYKWNFTGTLDRIIPTEKLLRFATKIFKAFQKHGRLNQSEILILPYDIVRDYNLKPTGFGFQHQSIDELHYPAWEQAVRQIPVDQETRIWVKVLDQPYENKIDFIS